MPDVEPVNLTAPKEELDELLRRKNLVEEHISLVERQIHALETAYLEETSLYGNVIRGFEGYLVNRTSFSQTERKKFKMREADRVFSMSSATYSRAVDGDYEDDERAQSPGTPNNKLIKRKKEDPSSALRKKARVSRDSDEYVDDV